MTFTDAIKTCFYKYVTFSGRAPRPEYWWFALFFSLGAIGLGFVENFINSATRTPDGPPLLSGAFSLVTLVPYLAVGWRRMHDTGRSGLHLIYPLVVVTGLSMFLAMFAESTTNPTEMTGLVAIVAMLSGLVLLLSPLLVLWWLSRPSQPGPNSYGPNPYEVTP
jgi:uncharacterized membrane protein YhaH (DUF805 family)